MTELKKPFWQYPPFIVLFDLLRLHRIKPWDVNIPFLLDSFLEKMKDQGYIDFYASGIALLSSATIHRAKSELILKMEEPPRPPQPRPDVSVPPPIPMPIRFQYTSTTIKDVLKSLEEVLSKNLESSPTLAKQILESYPIAEQLDEFLVNVEEHISEFYKILKTQAKSSKLISFIEITKDSSNLERVRKFVYLLFLASEKKIDLDQENEFGDIKISVIR